MKLTSHYRVTGRLAGRHVTAEFNSIQDPKLQGDELLLDLATTLQTHQVPVTLPGLGGGPANTNDPELAAATLNRVLDNGIETWVGDPLVWEQLPKDAIT